MEFDSRLTFDSLVVGPANRLASAAARRAAESPGTSYNPLFLYSAPGLGKSHILSAIGQYGEENHPDLVVMYQASEGYLEELEKALQTGAQGSLRERYTGVGMLLLDDIQFLADHAQAQEMLLRTIDELAGKGAQVVLAADRPPSEINGLDRRLLSRFSDGLIVDIGTPDYETRVTIVRKKMEQEGATLADGVAEAVARLPFKNVRELREALNRLIATGELEGRALSEEDVPSVLGKELAEAPRSSVPPELEGLSWRRQIEAVAESAMADSIAVTRLLLLLEESDPPEGWRGILQKYRGQIDRVRQIRAELHVLRDPWPEAASAFLADPDRLEEAENLLASAREKGKPFPSLPQGPGLERLEGRFPDLALKAAEQLIRADSAVYKPLYLHSPDPERALAILRAVGRNFMALHPEGTVAVVSVPEYTEEFIRAISEGVSGAWRERWWSVNLLLLHGVQELPETEWAQDEFFHLFEALSQRGARIVLAADGPPSQIEGLRDRLASRLEGGIVVELGGEPVVSAEREVAGEPRRAKWAADDGGGEDLRALREFAGVTRGRTVPPEGSGAAARSPVGSAKSMFGKTGLLSPERVVWDWPVLEDSIADEEDWREIGGSDGD